MARTKEKVRKRNRRNETSNLFSILNLLYLQPEFRNTLEGEVSYLKKGRKKGRKEEDEDERELGIGDLGKTTLDRKCF